MKTTQIQFRCSDTDRERYEAAAKVAGLSLSEWLRSLADTAAGCEAKAAKVPSAEKQVPFNPAGPAVETVPVKVRKPKKAGPKVIEVEAVTLAPKRAPAPGSPPPSANVDRKYTGETNRFNGVEMYEIQLPSGRKTWTKEPPGGEK